MILREWNFSNEAANSSLQQINRQKSARNLFVKQFDQTAHQAVLYDPKRKQTHTANLSTCDCVDFQRLKTVARPCMHIYRVAAECGLLTLDHMDRALAERTDAEARTIETQRLQSLRTDRTQWGNWPNQVHESFVQKNRQWRGYSDVYGVDGLVHSEGSGWKINGWSASLTSCYCPDFDERQLPCKHVYAIAILSKINLPLSRQHFQEIWDRGEELFFHPWGETCTKRQLAEQIPNRLNSVTDEL